MLYLGEAVRIRAAATDPETGAPLDPPPVSAVVDFWAPGRNPVKDLAVRSSPDVATRTMEYRTATADYVLYQATTDAVWVAGKWTYRVTVTGALYANWEYATFVLRA